METKDPGIDLEDWLNNPTKQGLPKKGCKKGDLYYLSPSYNRNEVAVFETVNVIMLACCRSPSSIDSDTGVRPARGGFE